MRPIKFRTWDTERKEWVLSIPPEEYMLDEDCWDDSNDPEDLMLYPANICGPFNTSTIYWLKRF